MKHLVEFFKLYIVVLYCIVGSQQNNYPYSTKHRHEDKQNCLYKQNCLEASNTKRFQEKKARIWVLYVSRLLIRKTVENAVKSIVKIPQRKSSSQKLRNGFTYVIYQEKYFQEGRQADFSRCHVLCLVNINFDLFGT